MLIYTTIVFQRCPGGLTANKNRHWDLMNNNMYYTLAEREIKLRHYLLLACFLLLLDCADLEEAPAGGHFDSVDVKVTDCGS
jgi:hypothetical protein